MSSSATIEQLRDEIVEAADNPAAFTEKLQELIGRTIEAAKANRVPVNDIKYLVEDGRTKRLRDALASIFVEGVALAAVENLNLLGNVQGYGASLCFVPVPFERLAKSPTLIANIAKRLAAMHERTQAES